jgi:hypothetical protein
VMAWNFKRFKWTHSTIEALAAGKLEGLSHAKIAARISVQFNTRCTGSMVQACWLKLVDKNYFETRPEFDDLVLATLEMRRDQKPFNETAEQCPIRASILHLLDLKRAGHSPRFTELKIESEYWPKAYTSQTPYHSYSSSPAALCVGD